MTTETPAAPIALDRIAQIAINAKDLPRAVAFYRDTLGLRFLFEAPPQMAFFQCGEVRLLIGVAEDEEHAHPASVLYYGVDDLPSAHDAIAARGVEVVGEPHAVHRTGGRELWMAFYRDSEDNTFALTSEIEVEGS